MFIREEVLEATAIEYGLIAALIGVALVAAINVTTSDRPTTTQHSTQPTATSNTQK